MYYIHNINPHHSAEFADLNFKGINSGLTKSERYPTTVTEFLVHFPSKGDADYALKNNDNVKDMRGKFPNNAITHQ